MVTRVLPLLGLLLCTCAAGAQTDTPLEAAVLGFLGAGDPAARRAAARAILELEPDPARLEELLGRGRAYAEDVSRGWSIGSQVAEDGVARPFHLFVPEGYTPGRRHPVVFNLHGGVSRPELVPEEAFREYRQARWCQGAEELGYLLVLPLGQAGAEWWTPVGASQVLGILAQLKRTWNVDENRVFCTGFSDGGSGAFYLALHHTTPFAGFLPLNGHIGVAQAGGQPIHLPNLSVKPLHVVNTGLDQLYPAAEVTPFIEAMREAGAQVTYKVYPELGHSPEYFPRERADLMRFVRETVRDPHPRALTWETDDPARGRCHWVVIKEIGEVGKDAPELATDLNPLIAPSRVRLGVYIDQQYEGTGVRIRDLVEGGSPAQEMGLAGGDIIRELDTSPVASFSDLRRGLAQKQPGAHVRVKVQRGEDFLVRETYFPRPEPRPAFRRERPAGRIAVHTEGNTINVQVRRVARYNLHLPRGLLDPGEPVRVITNGKVSFAGLVPPNPAFTLRMAGEDDDRTMLYWARLTIDLGGGDR